MASQSPTFEIGLAMAGAVSAGAYSSGVLDFLFQALDAWEQLKRSDPDSIPNHDVCIKVITGASAGSITGALAAAALAGGVEPTPYPGPIPTPPVRSQPYRYVMPALYSAWVLRPEMASPTGRPDLLDTSDLAPGKPIVSLLNSSLLDEIGDGTLRMATAPLPTPPAFGPVRGGQPIPYLAKRLHLYMTISNLRGVPYKVSFKDAGDVRGHGMLSHGDRTHYVLTNLGGLECKSDWAEDDRMTEADIRTLPASGAEMPALWQGYLQAALASSAFPIGLAPRQIDRDTNDYQDRMWPFPREGNHDIEPDWPEPWYVPNHDRAYSFVNVDGGLINNEPFEYAHFALMEAGRILNPRAATDANRAVILVDPFPQDPNFETDDRKLDRSIAAIVKALLPALMTQARFKPTELALALDETVYSRFLIAPRRADAIGAPMNYALATGLLGGFGGFLDQSLRDFDYQLGRRNCQKFLREAFVLDPKNGLFAGWGGKANEDTRFKTFDAAGAMFRPIVPLVGSAAPEVPLPPWPRLDAPRLKQIEDRITARAKILGPRLIEEQVRNRILRIGAKALWHLFGVDAVQDYAHLAIQQDLIRRDQHADWNLTSDDERNIFAALSDPAYDYRTVQGIAVATRIDSGVIATSFAKYPDRVYVASRLAPNGVDVYTLASRKPSWFSRNIGSLFNAPTIG